MTPDFSYSPVAVWYERETQDREALLRVLPKGSRGVEIGVWAGAFSREILDRVHPHELHLVDPWLYRSEPEFAGSGYGGRLARSQADMDQLFDLVRRDFGADPRVRVHRQLSVDAAQNFMNGSLDWIYLDGDHRYEAVAADLQAWRPKVAPGGLLTGDDYEEHGWWGDGVTRAVDDFATRCGWHVERLETNQFVLRPTQRTD